MGKYLTSDKDKGLLDFFCPVCGCNKFDRIERNVIEKTVFYLSFGNRCSKKFKCQNCDWTVLLGKGKKKH